MTPDSSKKTVSRRAPSRLELALMTVQMHGRAIVWGVVLLSLTLGLATVGILRTVTVGEPVAHVGTVIGIPSSQSIHVEVELGDGHRVMVPRGSQDDLEIGDEVAVTETSSALGTTGFQLSEATSD